MLKSALLRKLVLAGTATAAAALFAGAASAAVVRADVNAAPPFHDGACPFTFTFNANIESDRGGVVHYTWIRSDGATGPVLDLEFRGPGTRTVSTNWELSPPHFRGWEAVRIVGPNGRVSNRARIELTCH
jgi:hypothetical protein